MEPGGYSLRRYKRAKASSPSSTRESRLSRLGMISHSHRIPVFACETVADRQLLLAYPHLCRRTIATPLRMDAIAGGGAAISGYEQVFCEPNPRARAGQLRSPRWGVCVFQTDGELHSLRRLVVHASGTSFGRHALYAQLHRTQTLLGRCRSASLAKLAIGDNGHASREDGASKIRPLCPLTADHWPQKSNCSSSESARPVTTRQLWRGCRGRVAVRRDPEPMRSIMRQPLPCSDECWISETARNVL